MSDWKKALPIIAVLGAVISWAVFWVVGEVGMMPVVASREAVYIDSAFNNMMRVTVPIFGVVAATLIYILVNFRDDTGEGPRVHESRGKVVELMWISASVVLTMALAAYGAEEFLHIRGGGAAADLTVQVKAAQWSWEFYYPEQDVYTTELILPKGKRARIVLKSEDVVHSLWVPAFRMKQDALPHRPTYMLVTPTKTGTFDIVCAELCGLDHTIMRGKTVVVEEDEFDSRIAGADW